METLSRPLPREILFPPDRVLRDYYDAFVCGNHVRFVVGLAEGLAHDRWRLDGANHAPPHAARAFPMVRAEWGGALPAIGRDDSLRPLDWSSFPIRVDGVEVVIDFADWHLMNPHASRHPHWLRFHFLSSSKAYPFLGALTSLSFVDWADYDEIEAKVRADRDLAAATVVLNNQCPGSDYDSRHRRRLLVRGMLHQHFGDRVDFDLTAAAEFYAKAARALCYVAVPGSYENSLDRGQLQMIGLGVVTISPPIVDQCCDGLLQPGIHYLACRQDYRDVPDLVRWCDAHRTEAAAIGHNAWMFFQEFCTPLAVWSYIKDRIDHGPRHARGTIDDDLSPPGLYDPAEPPP